MKNLFAIVLASATLAFAIGQVKADVILTINATSNLERIGYTAGQAVTFNFVIAGDFSSPDSKFLPYSTQWIQQGPTSETLFSSITGTGLTENTLPPGDISYIEVAENKRLSMSARFYTDMLPPQEGLFAPNGSRISAIRFDILDAADWGMSTVPITPDNYFVNYLGAINVEPGDTLFMTAASGFDSTTAFTITSASISVVPEPSTWALLGLGAFAVLWQLRRRIA